MPESREQRRQETDRIESNAKRAIRTGRREQEEPITEGEQDG
jgi:hypothetical protein